MLRGRRRYNELAGSSIDRLAGISDGIFAVGMTLLVLGLALPVVAIHTESDLWEALKLLGPNLVVYTMSFMTLGIFWVGQGTQMSQLTKSNRNYAGLLARFPSFKLALVEYWLNIALLGVTLLASLEYALRADLFEETIKREGARLFRGRILIAQALYGIATALSLVFPTWVSILLIVAIQLNYVLAPRIPILHRF